MSATSMQSTPISGPVAAQGEPCAEINASCRAVVPLFLSAAGWLIAASVLGMIATLKFHSPNLLADHPWFTYGRVHPAASSALVYGFALQAGLGVALWLVCHIGRAKLPGTPMI